MTLSNAERQARFRQRQKDRIAELERENAALRAAPELPQPTEWR